MIDVDAPFALAGDFPPATRDEWLDAVAGVLLRGADDSPEARSAAFTRRLVTTTDDGIAIEPLFTAADAVDPALVGLPGSAPFVRGARAGGHRRGWDVRQRVEVTDDGAGAAPRVLAELEGGATSILLGLRHAPAVGVDVLDRALTSVLLDVAPVALDAGDRGLDAAAALVALRERRGIPGDAPSSLGLDPVGEAASRGAVDAAAVARDLDAAVAFAATVADAAPGLITFTVDAVRYHDAGASDGQELAAALATGVATVRALAAAGLPAASALRQLEFRFAASADQFLTIAKLRAARRTWARVAEVVGAAGDAGAMRTHAVTSTAMMTRYDPWVNLLRATVAAFAAGVGGADAVTVAPYDLVRTHDGSELGRRLARNTQAVLLDESNLARVIDPAGGSWYVERLTDDLARAAWDRFRAVEAEGGMVAALAASSVQRDIATTWAARSERLAHRRDPITGVSEFPDIGEDPPPAPSDDAVAFADGALPVVRRSGAFERQRGRADALAASAIGRPTVLLAALGRVAAHTARVTFAKNLFEAGGLRTEVVGADAGDDAEITAIADAVRTAAGSAPTLVCICSDDATYAERAADAAAAAHDAGATRIYLAGRPGDDADGLAAAGVDEFVFAGCDALAVITTALDVLEGRKP